jgi:hypothetical protein
MLIADRLHRNSIVHFKTMPFPNNFPPVPIVSSVEEILTRSIVLTKNLFWEFSPLWLSASLISTLQVKYNDDWSIYFLEIIVTFLFQVLIVVMAAHAWNGQPATLMAAINEITLSKVCRVCLLALLVLVVSFLLLFLLIIPGLVYLINRFLAFYIVILEDTPVDKAIERSKFLMNQERWYSLNSPAMRISVLTLVTGGVSLAIGLVVELTEGTIGLTQGNIVYQLSIVIGGIVSNAAYTFAAIAIVGFYYDLRARYDHLEPRTV